MRQSYCGELEQGTIRVEASVWILFVESRGKRAFYRYKRIIGGRLRAKNDDAQKREAAVGCAILNRLFEIGEPLSNAVG